MVVKLINKVVRRWHLFVAKQQFRGARLDNVILGPELAKRFEVRHPECLKVGYKSVMSGDLFINAWGGYKLESIAISPRG